MKLFTFWIIGVVTAFHENAEVEKVTSLRVIGRIEYQRVIKAPLVLCMLVFYQGYCFIKVNLFERIMFLITTFLATAYGHYGERLSSAHFMAARGKKVPQACYSKTC